MHIAQKRKAVKNRFSENLITFDVCAVLSPFKNVYFNVIKQINSIKFFASLCLYGALFIFGFVLFFAPPHLHNFFSARVCLLLLIVCYF